MADQPPDDVITTGMRQWRDVFPDLDLEPMAVVARLDRCAALLQLAAETPFVRAGLSRPEYVLLSSLRRAGPVMTPGRLARETFASGAAVTKRLRALEERGLVTRTADGRDRRVARVSLTAEGAALVEEVMPRQLEFDRLVLADLPQEDRDQLAALLGRLLVSLEGRFGALAR